MIPFRILLNFVCAISFLTPAFLGTKAEAAPTSLWTAGTGRWDDPKMWGGAIPQFNGIAEVKGASQVTIQSTEVALSHLDLGEKTGSDVSLTIQSGVLGAMEFIRVGEYSGSQGKLLVNGGSVCTTQIGLGGMNEGEKTESPCRAEMEVRGGSIITRYLSMGWRLGSTSTLRMVGAKAESFVVLNLINCTLTKGEDHGVCNFEFQLDADGVTPISLVNKLESIRFARKDQPGKCHLLIGLLAPPPSGEIPLFQSSKPCTGTFVGMPEGSPIRAQFGGVTYVWKLSYQGGASRCDVVLTHPEIVGPNGQTRAYSNVKPQRAHHVDSQAIKGIWERMVQHVDQVLPPLGTGLRAFPEAEGFGAYTVGGRGGKVLFVTNLNDSGPGSLRAAVETPGPRTVIFKVGGVIELKKAIQIKEPYLTIAGQTAPGDGICLKGATDTLTLLNTHDVIVRYLRVRTGYTGDREANQGDCISAYSSENFILDHCSTSWGTDETLSCTLTCDRYTVQWCVIAEGLDFYGHSMGSILGGDRSTWHHNLIAHNRTRNPRFAGVSRCDYRNNVIYDWGDTSGYGDFRAVNYVNNYLKPGPSTTQKPLRFLRPDGVALPGALFLSGNVMDGAPDITRENPRGAAFDPDAFALAAHSFPSVETQSATEAYTRVLKEVGATFPKRDSVDLRLESEVREGRGSVIRYDKDVGGCPTYTGGTAPQDSDEDGIPDEWEKAHGLNPNDPKDANALASDGYTNLEHYLNGLVSQRDRLRR